MLNPMSVSKIDKTTAVQISKGWWILEIGLGMVMLRRPGLTLVVAITVVGFWALVVGTLQVMAAFEVKDLPAKLKR